MPSAEAEWIHWASGIVSACLILPLWANWMSEGRIRIGQKGIFEPFIIGLLCGVGGLVASTINGYEWGLSRIWLTIATTIALLVTIIKSIQGTFITKEDEDEN